MKYIRQISLSLAILIAIVIVLQVFYINITSYEEERCWQELETTVEDVKKEIEIKFADEISKLHLIEAIMLNNSIYSVDEIDILHLSEIQPKTMFTRIDVLYHDNTLVSNGEKIKVDKDIDFDKLMKYGEYLTDRKTDFINGKPCVYYVLPIIEDSDVFAILIGVIDCENLYDLFQPKLYNGQANICIIDSEDGNYIMDDWHDQLGNVYDMTDRELLPDYKHIDFKSDIANLKSGTIAFVSESTETNIYMSYAPLNIFDWEVAVFTNKDVAFSNLLELKKSLTIVGVVEVLLLLLYFSSNIYLIKKLQKANKDVKEQKEKLEFLSYHDVLTGLYNRHKYFETLSFFMRNKPLNVGVIYIDLDGLKMINDTSSHEDGDEYICTAAAILTKAFDKCCYRIGGDEFIVMLSDISKDEFIRKINELNEYAKQQNASFSIGSVWQENSDNITEMINLAEKEMYDQKRIHHEALNEA